MAVFNSSTPSVYSSEVQLKLMNGYELTTCSTGQDLLNAEKMMATHHA